MRVQPSGTRCQYVPVSPAAASLPLRRSRKALSTATIRPLLPRDSEIFRHSRSKIEPYHKLVASHRRGMLLTCEREGMRTG